MLLVSVDILLTTYNEPKEDIRYPNHQNCIPWDPKAELIKSSKRIE